MNVLEILGYVYLGLAIFDGLLSSLAAIFQQSEKSESLMRKALGDALISVACFLAPPL